MSAPSNDAPEPQSPHRSPSPGENPVAPQRLGSDLSFGIKVACVVGVLWLCALAYEPSNLWRAFQSSEDRENPIPDGLLEAIAREQAAVKRLQGLGCITLKEYFDESAPSCIILSPLERRVADLTEGGSVIPVRWEVIIHDLIEAENHFEDLSALRHREVIQVQPRTVTDSTPRIIRRLPGSVGLILRIDGGKSESSNESAYHLLAGLPFTAVEVAEKPLSRSLSHLLPGFPKLHSLGLAYCKEPIADEVWADVARCDRLCLLLLWSVPVSDAGMKSIATIPQLKKLCFSSVTLGNRGLTLLPAPLELDMLTISEIGGFGDSYLGRLNVDPVELNLYRTGVKFRGWGRDWLLSRKRLMHVTIPDFDLSLEDAKAINALGGPQIELTSPCW
jgi:hypothetical protein